MMLHPRFYQPFKPIELLQTDITNQYISVHVRHGDFGTWCGSVPLDECFAPVKAIARRVEEVRSELQTRLGIYNTQVIVTSDEKDAKWWQEVENL